MTTQSRTCSACHQELPLDAPKGCCPRCLYGIGLCSGEEPWPADECSEAIQTDFAEFGGVQDFGDYTLLERIGQGGMGTVFKARQKSLNRVVALKLLTLAAHPTPEAVRRFRAEASLTAALQHPNIVAIHEVGFCNGHHFIAMEYVPGRPLSALLRGEPMPAREAARYLLMTARAVQYAHDQSILHRDLKPANVLVDLNGQPKVTDFGLAKRLDTLSGLTVTGQIVGSPSYMAPEQASGGKSRLSFQTDVYALGAILYHCLTGRAPFAGEGVADVVHQLLNNEPVSPRVLNPAVPVDLQTVCLKCLEKDSERRYRTAAALADDLDRFLVGAPVVARPVGLAGQAWRWSRRKPALACLGLALVLTVIGGFIGILSQLHRARLAEAVAQRTAYVAEMNLAAQAWSESNLGRTRRLLQRYAMSPRAHLRGWEWRWLANQARSDERSVIHQAGPAFFRSVALSPDGEWIAAANGEALKLWRADSLTLCAHTSAPFAMGDQILFANDGQRLFAGTAGVEILGVPELAPLGRLPHDLPVRGMALSADGALLATITDREVALWDTDELEAVATFGHDNNLRYGKVAISSDGRRVAYSDSEGRLHIYDRISKSGLSLGGGHRLVSPWLWPVLSLVFAPDGGHLVSSGADRTVRLWDLRTGKQAGELAGHSAVVVSLAFSPDGRTLASASGDQTIRLWDWPGLRNQAILRGHTDEVWGLAFSRDGRTLVSSGKDETIRVWDLPRQNERRLTWPIPKDTRQILLSADARRVGVLRGDGSLNLLDITNWLEQLTRPLKVLSTNALVVLDPKAQWLVQSTRSGALEMWVLPQATNCGLLSGHTGPVEAMAFSADSRWLASAGSDRTVRLWDMAQRGPAGVFPFAGATVTRIAVSADARHLALCLRDRQLLLLERATGKWQPGFIPHKMMYQVHFADDQATFFTAGYDGAVKLWDLRTSQCLQVLKGSLHGANSLAICPDRRTLAIGTGEGVIKLWNLDLFQEVGTLKSHRDSVGQLSISGDGQVLLSASQDAVCVWEAPPLAELDLR